MSIGMQRPHRHSQCSQFDSSVGAGPRSLTVCIQGHTPTQLSNASFTQGDYMHNPWPCVAGTWMNRCCVHPCAGIQLLSIETCSFTDRATVSQYDICMGCRNESPNSPCVCMRTCTHTVHGHGCHIGRQQLCPCSHVSQ